MELNLSFPLCRTTIKSYDQCNVESWLVKLSYIYNYMRSVIWLSPFIL